MISYSHLLTFMQEYNGIHWRNIMEWEFKRQAESPVACANLRPYQFRVARVCSCTDLSWGPNRIHWTLRLHIVFATSWPRANRNLKSRVESSSRRVAKTSKTCACLSSKRSGHRTTPVVNLSQGKNSSVPLKCCSYLMIFIYIYDSSISLTPPKGIQSLKSLNIFHPKRRLFSVFGSHNDINI